VRPDHMLSGLTGCAVSSPGPLAYIGSLGDPATVTQLLLDRTDLTPDAVFIWSGDTSVTFADALDRAARLAAGLTQLGLRRGDPVVVMLPNSLEFLDTWFALSLLGAVLVPLNTALVGDGLSYITAHCEARVAVVDANLVPVFDAAAPASLRQQIVVGGSVPGWTPFEQVQQSSARVVPLAVTPGELASILYTSGTTGLPKGVLNCHNSYAMAAQEYTRRVVEMRSDDVLMTSLPLFHVNAQMLSVVGAIVSGRPLVLLGRFSASRFLEEARERGATVFNYIGAMLTIIAKQPVKLADGENPLRLAVGGAAPAELWTAFEKRFGLTILEIYGLTETATFCLESRPAAVRTGKLGLATSWSEVQVHRVAGAQADRGEAGEIVVRSKLDNVLFKGYLKDAETTATAHHDGWFHTGDRGVQDDDGYFRFIDRTKDSIRRRGENISSYEIERAVNMMPGIGESAAVGVPSELGEEDVMVVVVRTGDVREEDICEWCQARMAAFMIPRYIRFVDSLPKTATQRVQKYLLRNDGISMAWDREANQVKETT